MASLLARGRSGINWERHPDLSEELRIYLAGLFDGEGNVTIRYRSAQATGGKQRWSLVAVTSNTDAVAMRQIHAAVGVGALITDNSKKSFKPVLQWTISGGAAVWFLTQIRPWLRVKERQADLAVKFVALIRDRRGSTPVSADNLVERLRLRDELMAMNKAGRPAGTTVKIRDIEKRDWIPPATDLPLSLRVYLAGLFDGEGGISIVWKQRTHSSWKLTVAIGMTEDAAVRSVYVAAGNIGTVYVRRQGQYRLYTCWQMSTRSAVWFLKQIRPWLQIRERQADIAIRFATLVAEAPRTRWNRPTQHNLFARHVLMQRLHSLNQKGRAAA